MSKSNCSHVPLELVLATTDPDLYDAQNNKWKWSGQMYWAVECLPHRQTTVSDRVVPHISASKYLPLTASPATWDYCLSSGCSANSDSMHVVFTFNPKSTDPNDYLQYVIDVHCRVTDSPHHAIKDTAGNVLYLDIVEVSKTSRQPYVEFWIAKSHQDQTLTIPYNPGKLTASAVEGTATASSHKTMWIVLIVVIVLILLIGLAVGGFFFFRHKKTAPAPVIAKPSVPVGVANIY